MNMMSKMRKNNDLDHSVVLVYNGQYGNKERYYK